MAKSPWITYFSSSPFAKLTLFCFPYAGGSASVFANWKTDLPSFVDIAAINLPGRGARMMETPCTQMRALIPPLADAISPFLTKPFVFFGHSLGATVAFELARELRFAQKPLPLQLLVAGRRAPHIANDSNPIHHLTDKEFKEEIRRKQGTPDEILNNNELMELVLPMLKADFQIADTVTYQDAEPLPLPITFYWGNEDKPINQNNDNAWGMHTSSTYRNIEIAGGHFFINTAKEALLKQLNKDLTAIL